LRQRREANPRNLLKQITAKKTFPKLFQSIILPLQNYFIMKLSAIILFSFFALAITKVSAQQRFIELRVTDTLESKPVQFTYLVSIASQANNYEESALPRMYRDSSDMFPVPQQAKKPKASFADITKLLDANSYHYTFVDEPDNNGVGYNIYTYNNFNNSSDSAIQIIVTKEENIKKLYSLLKKLGGITAVIKDIQYETLPVSDNTRYIRLYTKAKAQATLMAQASGNTIGQLISVGVSENPLSQLIEEMKNAEADIFKTKMYGKDFTKKVYRTQYFKFELK
jgi:hypothetical protein